MRFFEESIASIMTDPIRLAMLGMIPGNGHPYSWSAIINGYDAEKMAGCPYPVIPKYLGDQPAGSVGIPGVQVIHVWTDEPREAPLVAGAALIPHVLSSPEDAIGKVDAVIIATDDGTDHARRARPFVEAGVPVFVDKPLATTREELVQFSEWKRQGARILSSSGMRYAPELEALENQEWLWITSVSCKTWERYGIHALEPVYKLLGPGFTDARAESQEGSDIVYLRHKSGTQVTVATIDEAYGSFGAMHAYGRDSEKSIRILDTYAAFRRQLVAVADWLRSGREPFAFSDTQELMAILIAGIESRRQGGGVCSVPSILQTIFP